MTPRHSTPADFAAAVRRVLPRPEIVVCVTGLLVLVELSWGAIRYLDPYGSSPDKLLATRDVILLCAASAFGSYRIVGFHPLFNSEYRNWLRSSPWEKGKPLPLGTPYPNAGDVVVVAFMTLLLAFDPRTVTDPDIVRPSPMAIVALSIVAHAMTAAIAVWLTWPRTTAYAAILLTAVGVRLGAIWPPLMPLFLVIGWVVALKGISESWNRFPWDDAGCLSDALMHEWKTVFSSNRVLPADDISPDRLPASELGWPFAAMSPSVSTPLIGKRERLLIAGLICFWLHAVLVAYRDIAVVQGGGAMIVAYGVFSLMVVRLSEMGVHHRSPLNFTGRFFLLKWNIPGYDRVFGPSVLILATAVASTAAGYYLLGPTIPSLMPVVAFLTSAAFIFVGPNAETWRLTAPCRIQHGRLNQQSYEQLT